MVRPLIFLWIASALFAQPVEPTLAKMGVAVASAYRSGVALSFRDHTHPILIGKIRKLMVGRLGNAMSFAPASVTSADSVSKLNDPEVVDAFVKFVASVNQFTPHVTAKWSHSVSEVTIEGSRAKVTVAERLEAVNSNDGKRISTTSERLIEFQLQDGEWKYFAGPATGIHLDLPLGIL